MTLTEILVSVRELAFDRYPIPVFSVKPKQGANFKFVTATSTDFKINPNVGATTPDFSLTYPLAGTIEDLTTALITQGWPVAYSGYYSSYDSIDLMNKLTDVPLSPFITLWRRFFLSDKALIDIIVDYFQTVLRLRDTTVADIPTAIIDLEPMCARHLTLWVAIQTVDLRRISELRAATFNMNYSDGSGGIAGSSLNGPGQQITVQVGSVFTLTDDNSVTGKYFSENFNMVGSDNVLGDKESFWFKLFLYLRKKLEFEYADYYFREDNVIQTSMKLEKNLNYLAYFDSYPYTYSPHTRNLLS